MVKRALLGGLSSGLLLTFTLSSAAWAAARPPSPMAHSWLSRAELAQDLMYSFHLTPTKTGPLFTDVPAQSPHSEAIETVTGAYLMSGTRLFAFQPQVPATRLDLATALVNQLGLKDTASQITTRPAVTDAGSIPTQSWGVVDAALSLHLLALTPQGAFDANGPVTPALYAAAVAAEQGVTPAQIATVANSVANGLWLGFPYWENASQSLNVGQTIKAIAYQVEAGPQSELVVPGQATLQASAGTLSPSGLYQAPATPGDVTVTAAVPGTSIQATLPLTIYDPEQLGFASNTPMIATAGTALTLGGEVLSPDPSGSSGMVVDAADASRPLTLTITGPDNTVVYTHTASDQSGISNFQWTPSSAGTYTLALSSPGLPTVQNPLNVTATAAASASLSTGAPSRTYGTTIPITLTLTANPSTPLPAVLPIQVSASQGTLQNTVDSIDTAQAESPSGVVVGQLEANSVGSTVITASTPGGAFDAAQSTITVTPMGRIAVHVPSPETAGASVPVTATLTLANGAPAPAGISVAVTPTAPDGETGLLSTRSLYNSAYATTNALGQVTVSLADQYMSGTYQLNVAAPGFTEANTQYQINPGPAVRLDAVLAPSPFIMDGKSAAVSVTAVDQYGNPVPSDAIRVQVHFQGRDGHYIGHTTMVHGVTDVGTVDAGRTAGSDTVIIHSPRFPRQMVRLPVRVITNPSQIIAGKGTWATYGVYATLGANKMVQMMKAEGMTHLYLETAASGAGFYGQLPLDRIVDLAHQNGIAVITWSYAALTHLTQDEADAKAALQYRTRLGSQTDGYTGDFEVNLKGTALKSYSQFIRRVIGPDQPYIATVYPPQDNITVPYGSLTPYVNAIAPMDYWHATEADYTFQQVYNYVKTSIADIRHQAPKTPIEIIAESYDMWSNSAQGLYSPTAVEEEGAIEGASNNGASSISFYDLGTATAAENAVIGALPYPLPKSPMGPPVHGAQPGFAESPASRMMVRNGTISPRTHAWPPGVNAPLTRPTPQRGSKA